MDHVIFFEGENKTSVIRLIYDKIQKWSSNFNSRFSSNLAFSKNDDIKNRRLFGIRGFLLQILAFAMITYFKRLKLSTIRITSNQLLNKILHIYSLQVHVLKPRFITLYSF